MIFLTITYIVIRIIPKANVIKNLSLNISSILSIKLLANEASWGNFSIIIFFIKPTNKNGIPIKIHDIPMFLIPLRIPDSKIIITAVIIVKIKIYFKFCFK